MINNRPPCAASEAPITRTTGARRSAKQEGGEGYSIRKMKRKTEDTTPKSGSSSDNGSSVDETKPLTGFAPPPLSAALSIALFFAVSIYFLPSPFSDEDEDTAEIFNRRVFPGLVSYETLLCTRLLFVFVCFVGFVTGWTTPPVVVETPYRPRSRCPRIPIVVSGWRKQRFLTAISWNLLGISFALAAYIGSAAEYDGKQPRWWLVPLARTCWEISAPMTLLVSAVVKYALWPAEVAAQKKAGKSSGTPHVFLAPRSLLQHNANAIMAVLEVTVLGGLPVRIDRLSVPVIYGTTYVVLSYAAMLTWHGQGPAFVYFFLDTTTGREHTVALYALLLVLVVFYGVFCGMGQLLELIGGALGGNDNENYSALVVAGHAAYAAAICALVCRFRD